MHVGIYLYNAKQADGGGATLVNTIHQLVKNSSLDIQVTFLSRGGCGSGILSPNSSIRYVDISRLFYPSGSRLANRLAKGMWQARQYMQKKSTRQTWWDLIAARENIDLFWFTSPICAETKCSYVFTVWDLAHRTTPSFPEVRTDWHKREKLYTTMLSKASYVITGNQAGKKEILENYPIAPEKIHIIPFPVSSFCAGNGLRPAFLKENSLPFFFYPAQFWSHKNHIVILEALSILRKKHALQPVVYFTGSDKGNRAYIEQKILDYQLSPQVFLTGFISDEELKYLYTHATGMIFASLFGPNNLPPIEATVLGCPMVITNLEGHREQLGDTALYFNGLVPNELANCLANLLTQPELASEMRSRQQHLAIKFLSTNYLDGLHQILTEFQQIRKTWGKTR